ncbi:MAG: FMN-binding negative transcriptional regulator [Alphaproteobacteria bacterium]|nr:FMN-binding negative transcriptional regulator [Alphaproteobacteria bacterium]
MYVPGHFKQDDQAAMHALMQAHPFALLVSVVDGAPFATHVPVVLDPAWGARGTLRMHVARANPHWRGLETDPACMLVFQGPNAYVSPGWYDKHPAVPTWNYVAVHAHGRARAMDDGALRRLLDDLSAIHEASQLEPWTSAKLTEEWFANMRKAVVGLEVEIERLEGKFKLSQNRPEGDRRNVIQALSRGNEGARAIAAMMREREEA